MTRIVVIIVIGMGPWVFLGKLGSLQIMVLSGCFRYSDYPLVMTNIAMWKITMDMMGKSTISMAISNSKLFVYQRVVETCIGMCHCVEITAVAMVLYKDARII